MNINCKALKISICISCISLIVLLIFTWLNIKYEYMIIMNFIKDVALGIFCSSIITVFFYISAYKIEKKKLLERYWNAIRELLIQLYKIEYLDVKYDEEIIINYINERKHSIWMKEYNKISKNNLIEKEIEKEMENTNVLLEILKKDNAKILSQLSEEGKEIFLNEKLEKIDSNITVKIGKIIDEYEQCLKSNTKELNFMLGEMQFFSGENNYIIAHNLYKDLYELFKKIQIEISHFRYYVDGKGNKAIVLEKILKLQKLIFRVEEETKEEYSSKNIYNEFNDIMNKKLEEFRANIIYHIKPEFIEKIPILSINIKKDIDE